MPQSDTVLLDKWRASSDADAFAELLSRHASMVYGACLRVVRNPGTAEEVAQECFLELMKGPRGIQCIGAWLHTVATRRALDRVKSESRRNEREKLFAASLDTSVEASWDDTREFVDEAIASLPNDLRIPIVLRFLEGRTHEAIAEELSISRSSARSRIERGIIAIRENLATRGVLVGMATLATGLEHAAAQSVPQSLIAELGKHALAAKLGASSLITGTGVQLAAGVVLLAGTVASIFWFSSGDAVAPDPAPPTPSVAAVVSTSKPAESESTPEVNANPILVPDEIPVVQADTPDSTAPLPEEDDTAEGWKLDLTPSEKLKDSLQATTKLEFENIHIKDILEFLQDSYNLNLVLDTRVVAPEQRPVVATVPLSRRYITDGMVRSFYQKDKSVEEALTLLTRPLNLTPKIRGNMVWISSSSQITEDMTVPLPSAPFKDAPILKSLSSPVNIEFEAIHISDVLDFLRQSFKVNIILDTQVVTPEPKEGENEASSSSAFATDGMIGYINAKDVPMAEALYTLTRLINLTYRVDKDRIYISTPDRVKGTF